MPKYFRQTITPEPFSLKEHAGDNWKDLVVRMSNPTTCFRYLLSKIVYTDKEITYQEAVIAFMAFDEMIKKIEIDPIFRQKYGWTTFVFRSVFQSLEFLVEQNPDERYRKMQETFGFFKSKIVSRRYYFSVEGQSKKLYEAYLRKRFPKKFPAKSFIAKGYGDNGTAKNTAFDGNPAWQEVAMAETAEKGDNRKDVNFYRQYQVHELQRFRAGT
jgi:hypothetical protein